jgi:hypothetical protein
VLFLQLMMMVLYTSNFHCTKLLANDSLILISLLSSAVNTLWIFGLLLIYNQQYIIISLNSFIPALLVLVLYYLWGGALEPEMVYYTLNTTSHSAALQNGFLNIHPLLIYYSYSITLYIWFGIYFILKTHYFTKKQGAEEISLLWVVMIGILLGASWAAQELNWGGFWSWDPVELISLLILFILLGLFHVYGRAFFFYFKFAHVFKNVFLIYWILRGGAVSTIHSFVSPLNNTFLVIIWLFGIFLYYISLVAFFIIKPKKVIIFENINIFNSFFYVFIVALYIIIYQNNINIINIRKPDINLWTAYVVYLGILFSILPLIKFIIDPCKKYVSPIVFLFFVQNQIIILYIYIQKYIRISSHKSVHIFFLYAYIINYVFFNSLSCYNSYIIDNWQHLTSLSHYFSTNSYNQLYESYVWINKKYVLYKYKSLHTHITGFNIISNMFELSYLYCKNYLIKIPLLHETLGMPLIGVWFIILGFYKYSFSKKIRLWQY